MNTYQQLKTIAAVTISLGLVGCADYKPEGAEARSADQTAPVSPTTPSPSAGYNSPSGSRSTSLNDTLGNISSGTNSQAANAQSNLQKQQAAKAEARVPQGSFIAKTSSSDQMVELAQVAMMMQMPIALKAAQDGCYGINPISDVFNKASDFISPKATNSPTTETAPKT